MADVNRKAIKTILNSIVFIINNALKNTTKVYDGIVVSDKDKNGYWEIKYNGETHLIKKYGEGNIKKNSIVKIIIPQGNQTNAWFF